MNNIEENLKDKIIESIIVNLKKHCKYLFHMDDIGCIVGDSISQVTCTNEKEIIKNAQTEFIDGFKHGYSLNNGTH